MDEKTKKKKEIDKKNQNKKFKEDYFAYYDDVKSHTHKVVDW